MLVHKKELLIPTVDEGPGEMNCSINIIYKFFRALFVKTYHKSYLLKDICFGPATMLASIYPKEKLWIQHRDITEEDSL